ncbi:MAG: hypothetical protein WA717_09355 [Methyloceanibacter sp.]
MKRRLIAASAIALVAATSAYATALTEKQVEGVETTIKAIGCTVEETDITTKGDGYKADDVECKDGQTCCSTRTSRSPRRTKRTRPSSLSSFADRVRASAAVAVALAFPIGGNVDDQDLRSCADDRIGRIPAGSGRGGRA